MLSQLNYYCAEILNTKSPNLNLRLFTYSLLENKSFATKLLNLRKELNIKFICYLSNYYLQIKFELMLIGQLT